MTRTLASAYSCKLWFFPSIPGRLKSGASAPIFRIGGISADGGITSSCAQPETQPKNARLKTPIEDFRPDLDIRLLLSKGQPQTKPESPLVNAFATSIGDPERLHKCPAADISIRVRVVNR